MSLSLRFAVCLLFAVCLRFAVCSRLLRVLLCSMSVLLRTAFTLQLASLGSLSLLNALCGCSVLSGNFGLARWVLLQEIPAPYTVAMGSLYSGTLLDL